MQFQKNVKHLQHLSQLISNVVTVIALHLFPEILKLARRESHSQISKTTQCEQDALEMQVRAANMGMWLAYYLMKLY